jgi:dihydroflavonol-4-reductase
MTLAVINPVAIFGPVLGPDYATSVQIVAQMLSGALPGLPHLTYGVVDVRDVADLHLRAMTQPAAAGQRFLAAAGMLTLPEMAQVLKARLGAAAGRVPTRALPDGLVRLLARVSPQAGEAVPNLGQTRNSTGAKAQRVLGWAPRSKEDALVACAESLLRLGLVKPPA